MNKSMQVKTKRLRITLMTDEEIAQLMADTADDHLRAAYGEMLEGSRQHQADRQWYAPWRMRLRDGQAVGDLCFKGTAQHDAVEIGYGVEEPYQGQGYATEAVKAMTDWALGQENVWFVEAQIEAWNDASRRVLEKCGFKPDGMGEEGPLFVTEKPDMAWVSFWMCIGMSMGLSIGTAMENLATGMGVGLALGVAVGAAVDAEAKKKRDAARKRRSDRRSGNQAEAPHTDDKGAMDE